MAATSSVSSDRIDLASIGPFSPSQKKKVPAYLFENASTNQTRKSYDSRYLSILREKARGIQPSDIKGYKGDDSRKVEIAREFDWVFGLDQLEKEYLAEDRFMLDTVLKIEDILKLNR